MEKVKMEPKISVVMAVYNMEERFLREAIESVLSQTYSNFEFIIVNDGSTDGTSEIFRSYKDHRIKVFNLPHQGLTKSLNFGIKNSKGQYIARQDADDISIKERFENQVCFLEAHGEVGVLGSFADWIDEEGKYLFTMVHPTDPHEIREHLLKFSISRLVHGSVMIRRSVIDDVGLYDESLKVSQDYDFWIRISERYNLANLPVILYKKRYRAGALSRSFPDHIGLQIKTIIRRRAHQKEKENLREVQKRDLVVSYKKFEGTRILLINSYHTNHPYILKDLQAALRNLKYSFKIVDLPHLRGLRLKNLADEINKFKPDFILSINGIHFTEEVIEFLEKNSISFASWFVDDPFKYLKEKDLSPHHAIFVFDKSYIAELKRRGVKQVFYLPLATNREVFFKREGKLNGKILTFYGYSFYPYYLNFKSIIKEILRRVLKEKGLNHFKFDLSPIFEILTAYAKNPTSLNNIENKIENFIYKELGCKFSFQGGEWSKDFKENIERAANFLYQMEILKSLPSQILQIWGDLGWKNLGEVNSSFLGEIKSRAALSRLYNSGKINLNITGTEFKTTINPKVFDILATGSFLLTDYREDLRELFRLDEEIVCYESANDLREKIKYFLKYPRERAEIANRGRERVLNNHSYEERIKRIQSALKNGSFIIQKGSGSRS